MELEKPTPLIFDYLPELARLVRPVHGAITDGEVIGKVEAVPPVPLAAGLVGGAGEKPSPLVSVHTDRGTSSSNQPEGREVICNLALSLWAAGHKARA